MRRGKRRRRLRTECELSMLSVFIYLVFQSPKLLGNLNVLYFSFLSGEPDVRPAEDQPRHARAGGAAAQPDRHNRGGRVREAATQ